MGALPGAGGGGGRGEAVTDRRMRRIYYLLAPLPLAALAGVVLWIGGPEEIGPGSAGAGLLKASALLSAGVGGAGIGLSVRAVRRGEGAVALALATLAASSVALLYLWLAL